MNKDPADTSWTAEFLRMRSGAEADLTLEPALLCERASKFAGLSDFGSPIERELESLCRSFNEEARLAPSGKLVLSWHVIQALVTRLRLVRLQQQSPEIFGKPLNDPIIIVGLPRSGSTFLQELLCALPDTRFLSFWEAREPIPGEGDDDRKARFAVVADLISRGAPELEWKHPVNLQGPEECMYFLDPSLVSLSFVTSDVPCPAYFKTVLGADQREPYRIYRLLLEYIQSLAPGKRLILKSPAHLGTLDSLVRAVPEAKLVQTHRDPLSVLPSLCSLFETLYRPSLTRIDRKELGAETRGLLEALLARGMAARRALPETRVFDLGFDVLTQDPRASVERIFEHFGLAWSQDCDTALGAKLAAGLPKQVGRHRYDLGTYGLSASELAERFSVYRRRWGFSDDD